VLSVLKLVKNPEKINVAMEVTWLSEFLAIRV
jgi:Tfp pilus assembly protein PilZ